MKTRSRYWIGSIEVIGNVDELKELTMELQELSLEAGIDLSNRLGDFCFSVNVDYQNYYGLDQDDWGIKEKEC